MNLPTTGVFIEDDAGVAGQYPSGEVFRGRLRAVQSTGPGRSKLADWFVAGLRDFINFAGRPNSHSRHFVLGERSRFVGADDIGATERFDCWQAAVLRRVCLAIRWTPMASEIVIMAGSALWTKATAERDAEEEHFHEGLPAFTGRDDDGHDGDRRLAERFAHC